MGVIYRVENFLKTLRNQNYELIWAKTWDDTKRGIGWIEGLSGISPGRMAVGYNYLYVMTRVLNEIHPSSVLDLGLGISSTLISQYFIGNSIENGVHDVVEHDEEWASFYTLTRTISNNTVIYNEKIVEKEYEGTIYFAYENIGRIVKNKKYEVISIDGPWGSPKRSRRDVVEYIPDILNESFIIIVDDSQREGEKATVIEIVNKLKSKGIECCCGDYPGMTQCTVIASKNNRFFCSM